MQNYIEEPGLLYDCLSFLSFCTDNTGSVNIGADTFLHIVKDALLQNGVTIPEHLSPIISRQRERSSFLSSILIDGLKYSRYEFDSLTRAMKNPTLLKSKFAEFYFPKAGAVDIQKLTRIEYPAAFNLINELDPSLQTGFIYTLYHFDEAMRETAAIVGSVWSETEKLHRQFIEKNKEALGQIRKPPVSDKLRTISGVSQKAELRFSLSLTDPEQISYTPEEPDFFILGNRFEEVLDTRYKYCHVTPASFVRDLGNDAKRIIFEALLSMRSMSAADMETRLHLSRNAVARNIKAMRECGVVTAERKGLSYYYMLNREYINILTERLEHLKWET